MSGVDTLRQAAALMRERAEAATPGPWESRGNPGFGWVALYVDETAIPEDESLPSVEQGGSATDADTVHIASWHPTVALAVAKAIASALEEWGDTVPLSSPMYSALVTVARVYLGEAS